jgi:hypothetical protein
MPYPEPRGTLSQATAYSLSLLILLKIIYFSSKTAYHPTFLSPMKSVYKLLNSTGLLGTHFLVLLCTQ